MSDPSSGPVRWQRRAAYGLGASGVYLRSDTAPSTNLYHYLPWQFATLLITNRQLRLAPPESWPDPHERWWCDALFSGNNRLRGVRSFAQCWTTSHLDEAFWRIVAMSAKGPVVRLRTTVSRLEEVCSQAIGARPGKAFIGRVEYPELWVLAEKASAVRRDAVRDVASSAATALLTKRRAFKFENEVRLLWIERGTTDAEVFLPIDPLRCIRQIMLGPLTTPAQGEAIEKSLLGFGFAEDAIARSTIYAPPSV